MGGRSCWPPRRVAWRVRDHEGEDAAARVDAAAPVMRQHGYGSVHGYCDPGEYYGPGETIDGCKRSGWSLRRDAGSSGAIGERRGGGRGQSDSGRRLDDLVHAATAADESAWRIDDGFRTFSDQGVSGRAGSVQSAGEPAACSQRASLQRARLPTPGRQRARLQRPPVSGHAVSGRAVSGHAFSDRPVSGHAVSGRASRGRAPRRRLSRRARAHGVGAGKGSGGASRGRSLMLLARWVWCDKQHRPDRRAPQVFVAALSMKVASAMSSSVTPPASWVARVTSTRL